MAEAAGAASALLEPLDDFEPRLDDRHEDHLRNTLARCDRVARFAAIPARHEDLALIVGIDEPGEVSEHDAMLVPQTRSRKDHRGETRIGNVYRNTGRNQHG